MKASMRNALPHRQGERQGLGCRCQVSGIRRGNACYRQFGSQSGLSVIVRGRRRTASLLGAEHPPETWRPNPENHLLRRISHASMVPANGGPMRSNVLQMTGVLALLCGSISTLPAQDASAPPDLKALAAPYVVPPDVKAFAAQYVADR